MNTTTAWACTSIGACVTGFVTAALPFLQAISLIVAIVAGIRAIIVSRRRKEP